MGQRETVLDISGLHSSYGMIKAIKDINIHVDKGELVSLLGANGAGKSTLLKSIIGMVHIESGSVKYQGEELVGRKSHEIIPMGISIVPEGRKIFADATVMENLAIGSYTRAADKALDQKILDQVFEFFPRLAERKGQMGGTLSGGEQQMLAIGRAMMSDPKLLLLDEPSMGLAPLVVEQVFSWPGLGSLMVQSINARDYPMIMGITVVIAAAVLVGNVLTDIAYSLLDPKIRESR